MKHTYFLPGILMLAFALGACDQKAAAPAAPAPSVSVKTVAPESVPLKFQYAGRVAAFREVEIRARVAGVLLQQLFTEGAKVEEGDMLFQIDPATYEAALAQAQSQLAEAEAQFNRTMRDAERATILLQKQVGTEKARDDATAAHELARASITGAQAQVKTAQINLEYTKIRAPISGVASLRMLPEGSLVGTSADNSLLTRISQLDPVHVHFSFTDTESAEIRRLIDSGEGKGPADGRLKVKISFGDGKAYDKEGYIDFTDSNLDIQTGTLRARAVVPNPEQKLRPGQFVRLSVEGVTRLQTIVVPQAAVMQGQQGYYVYTVEAEDKAAIRPISIGREVEGGWIVEKGLKSGDRYVSEGVIKVRPGQPVSVATADVRGSK